MFLYNITLQRATGITHAIHGNFSGELSSFFPIVQGIFIIPDGNNVKLPVQGVTWVGNVTFVVWYIKYLNQLLHTVTMFLRVRDPDLLSTSELKQ